MTISNRLNRTTLLGNGVSTLIPIEFPFHSVDDLVVIETILATGAQTIKAMTTHYTVTGAQDALGHYPTGGSVVMVSAPASTVSITVYRDVSALQQVILVENEKIPVKASIESPLDRLTMIAQRLIDRVDRTMTQPDGDSANIGNLPAKVVRASRYLGFDGDGNPTMMQTPTGQVTSIAQLVESTIAGLPAAGSAGTLRKLTNGVRGVWMDTGVQWTPVVPFVDGAMFNIIGDGVADDTAELQAAVTAAEGRTLVLPNVSVAITISDAITLPSNITILSTGRTLIQQTDANKRVFVAASKQNICIQGLRIDGASTTSTLGNAGLIDCSSCTDVRILDNEVFGSRNGITATRCTDLWIQRNHVHDYKLFGILASESKNFHIDGNNVHDSDETGAAAAYGIMATGDEVGGQTQIRGSISFNYIYNIPSWSGIMTHDCDGLHIIGNDIRNVRNGIDIGHLAATNVIKNLMVVYNTVIGTLTNTWGATPASNHGIGIFGYDATHRCENVSVVGNVVKQFGQFTSPSGIGNVVLMHCADINVNANTLVDAGTGITASAGILFQGTCTDISVTGNAIRDCSAFAVCFSAATATVIAVTGNSFYNVGGTMTVGIQIRDTSTIVGLSAAGNAHNLSDTNYIVQGSGTTVTWPYNHRLSASKTWDPASVANGAQDTTTITVTGAALGDRVLASFSLSLQAIPLSGYVSAADTVTVVLANTAAGTINLGSGTLRVDVFKA